MSYTQTDPMHCLEDLARKEWTVAIYLCDLGTVTVAAKRGKKQYETDGFGKFGIRDAILAVWDKVHETGSYAV